jgi:hypothetical protein
MRYLERFRSSERRYRHYVTTDLQQRAPEALGNIERNVPASVVDAAFAFAWDHHQETWNAAHSMQDFDRVAEESSVTIMHHIVDAMRKLHDVDRIAA